MEATDVNLPFTGTPWNSEEEIRTFIREKRAEKIEWGEIKILLTNQGLPDDYAQVLIEKLKPIYMIIERPVTKYRSDSGSSAAPVDENQQKKSDKWFTLLLAGAFAFVGFKYLCPWVDTFSPTFANIIGYILGFSVALSLKDCFKPSKKK